jgi:hypothetical protein
MESPAYSVSDSKGGIIEELASGGTVSCEQAVRRTKTVTRDANLAYLGTELSFKSFISFALLGQRILLKQLAKPRPNPG